MEIIISGAAVLVAIVIGVISARHSQKGVELSSESARKDREDMLVADAREKGVFGHRLGETEEDVDHIGQTARKNREEIAVMKTDIKLNNQQMASVQNQLTDVSGKLDRLISLHLKDPG